jgi:hypothetical protein
MKKALSDIQNTQSEIQDTQQLILRALMQGQATAQ